MAYSRNYCRTLYAAVTKLLTLISMHSSEDPRDGGISDRWFVTNGVVAVGPISYELVLRGVAYGRIPAGSFVRHESWQVWRRLEDIEAQSAGNRRQIIA